MAYCMLDDPAVQKAYKDVIPDGWLRADADVIDKIGDKRIGKFHADEAERVDMMMECKDPEAFRRLRMRTSLDDTLLDEEWLHGATGLGHKTFFYIVARLEDTIRANPEAPLFRYGVDPKRAPDRGNRCSLAVEHMLCMTLYRIWTGCSQEALQGVFKVDQTTASRNIRMVRGMLANANILPTDLSIMDELAALPKKEADAAVGGVLNLDWTNIEIEKPVDTDSNNESFSGKVYTTTCKVLFGCSGSGLLSLRGPMTGGRGGEITYLRENLPDVGPLTASMTSPETPDDERITVNLDGGPQGASKALKGAKVRMPHRTPKKGELTREQKDYNSKLAGERAIIENVISDIKNHRILRNVFRGSVPDLEETTTVVTGLVNLKLIMRQRRGWTPDTHRKRLKPGPKKPGPRGRKSRHTFRAIE